MAAHRADMPVLTVRAVAEKRTDFLRNIVSH